MKEKEDSTIKYPAVGHLGTSHMENRSGSGMPELDGDSGKKISCGQHFGMEVFDSSVY